MLKEYKILFVLTFCIILTACGQQPVQQKSDNTGYISSDAPKIAANSTTSTISKSVESDTKNNAPTDSKDVESNFQNEEAKYFPTDNPKYKKIGNGRFNFWIDIPVAWKAFDRSANGDGYIIVSDNENIDIRTYGGLNAISANDYLDALKGDSGKISDFVFKNNTHGKQIEKPDLEINFTCLLPDRHIDFFINYKNNKNWFVKNKDDILYIAKSLRSGEDEINTQ